MCSLRSIIDYNSLPSLLTYSFIQTMKWGYHIFIIEDLPFFRTQHLKNPKLCRLTPKYWQQRWCNGEIYTYVRGPDIEVEAVLVLAGKSAHAGYEQAEGLWADGLETSSKQRPLPPRVSLWGLDIYNMILCIFIPSSIKYSLSEEHKPVILADQSQ